MPPGVNTDQELLDAILHSIQFKTALGQFNSENRFCVTTDGYIGIVPAGTLPGNLV